ncbi:peptidase M48 Ste24p [Halogeometricum pallidum JCM 14848]|uniref:Peptidase M48 Ste24p n=1 Tax=Halogeometricum pallidum JCM 14848 TaxID=1227487 RepID=M0D7X0_HALPD|nr:M48 family metalloprotease [Halogeometricum pallidum]ELZ31585.1 peptidase M48 Ste24p [Halogeometricum pallidum JCM 14848]
MPDSLLVRTWALTLGVLSLAVLSVVAVVGSGGSPLVAAVAVPAVAVLVFETYRSGGRFTFEAGRARPLDSGEFPEVERALSGLCERTGRPVPRLLVMEMDAPGAVVGYDDGRPVVAFDPLLPRVVGVEGVSALFAHELGHLGTDLHTDALRAHAPPVVGFGVFWLAFLAGRGPVVATVGTLGFAALALTGDPRLNGPRYALGLGAEPLVLAVSRYANRLEEYAADAYAADVVGAATLAEALYHAAVVAAGENDEDVAGPVPWTADRSLRFALFATHPPVEDRVTRLGRELPGTDRSRRPPRPSRPDFD